MSITIDRLHPKTKEYSDVTEAFSVADRCNLDDPDWTYKVELADRIVGHPIYHVVAYDECGERMGAL